MLNPQPATNRRPDITNIVPGAFLRPQFGKICTLPECHSRPSGPQFASDMSTSGLCNGEPQGVSLHVLTF